jgi:hypothetical protein
MNSSGSSKDILGEKLTARDEINAMSHDLHAPAHPICVATTNRLHL